MPEIFYRIHAVGWPSVVCEDLQQAEEFAAALCFGLPADVEVIRSDGCVVHEFFKATV